MQKFPDEAEAGARVQDCLSDAFQLAESLLNVWLTHDKDRCLRNSNLPDVVLLMGMALDVQACRLFRSVIEECKRCEAYTASILTRTLYETVLGTGFVLAKRLKIVVDAKGSPGAMKYVARLWQSKDGRSRKHWLSQEKRGKLYYVYCFLEQEGRGIERLERMPGNKRSMTKAKKSLDPNLVADYEKAIGPEWTYILRNRPFTYSGLSVGDLSRILHKCLRDWYETIYYFQSRDVHGSNPMQHMEFSENVIRARYLSTDSDVEQALKSAIGIFFAHMTLMHEMIGFGTAADIAFASLKRRFNRLHGREQ